MDRSGVRYADAGDVSIAYEVVGDGPVDLVYAPGFVSHLDLQWEAPSFVALMRRLSAFARVVIFDKRGTGESDRTLGFGSAAERMDDIRAVMDADGLERASLYGLSEGGPLSVLFSATYPERVDRLVLRGTYARMMPAPGYDPPFSTDPERFVRRVEERWGTGSVLGLLVEHDEEQVEFAARYERSSASPKMAATIMRSNLMIDVREALGAISAPTLVVHNSGDPMVPAWHGRFLAEHIPDARLVEIDAAFHASLNASDDEGLDAVEAFLGQGHQRARHIDRVLATVLFTDIVDSTSRAADLGDERWRALLDRHDRACRAAIERHHGVFVKSTGDGVLGRFDGPGRAVDAADEIRRNVAGLGVEVRAGLHTGEVELRDDDVTGIAVHIASRVAGTAGAGEVLVSRTVRDLTAGSGLTLLDRGDHRLKGLDEPWQLFALA